MKQLVKLASGRMTIPVLTTVRVLDGVAMATDLDIVLRYHGVDKPDGLYAGKGIAAGAWVKFDAPMDDYPHDAINLGENVGGVEVMPDDLEWVWRAASYEETRFYICGVNFNSDGIVATDGHRLHQVKQAGIEGSFTVPNDAIKIILAAVKEEKIKEPLLFTFMQNDAFMVGVGKYFIKGKLRGGAFPDYRRVIPSHDDAGQTVYNHKELAAVSKEVKALHKANGGRHGAPVKFDSSGMTVRAGEFSKTFPTSMQFDVDRGFNFALLEDVALDGAVMTYEREDNRGPVKIVKDNRLAVLMPLRV